MPRLITLLAALILTFGGAASAFEFQSSKVPGRGNPSLCATDGERIIINRADRTITTCNPDGSQSVNTLINALPAGRKAIELGDASDLLARTRSGSLRSIASRLADLPSSVVDYGAVCASTASVATAVASAVADGVRVIRLPANCTYIPPGTNTPNDLTIIGADPYTSIVAVTDRTTQYLNIGARAKLQNVGIISKFCDDVPQPQGVQKVCPAGEIVNASDTPTAVANWVGQGILHISGPNYTGPNGVQSHDLPSIASIAKGMGSDAFFAGADGDGTSGLRAHVTGPNANGVWIFNGLGAPAAANTRGLNVNEYGDGLNGQRSLYFNRIGAATSISADDLGGTGSGRNNPFMELTLTRQTGGSALNLYHATSQFNGSFLNINAGNGGGAFGGSFVNFQRGGATVFAIDAGGTAYSAGNLQGAGLVATGSSISIQTFRTPASSTAPCTKGEISIDETYQYVCTATNHWKRSKPMDDF